MKFLLFILGIFLLAGCETTTTVVGLYKGCEIVKIGDGKIISFVAVCPCKETVNAE